MANQYTSELLAQAKRYVSYDPETGVFTIVRQLKLARHKVGDVLGKPNKFGYLMLSIQGASNVVLAHRLAWLGYRPQERVYVR